MNDLQAIREVLRNSTSIAIVGAKDKASQPVHDVGHYLLGAGYRIIPVHPKRTNVWNLTTYPTLSDIPDRVDIVDLFRAASFCPDHAREALQMAPRPKAFWMQQGIVSPEAKEILADSGIMVVEDLCIKTVHRQTE